jgi:hypothetical protein
MKKFVLLSFLLLISSSQALRMKRVTFLNSGADLPSTYVVCADTDNDSLNEVIFSTMAYTYVTVWKIYEHRPMNRYELVFADTGAYPYPPGITTGNFRPNDVGDIDRDSLTDLVGHNEDKPMNPDTIYHVVTTQENPYYSSYPETLSWWYRYSNNFSGDGNVPFYFPPDLDSDSRNEIMFVTSPPLGVVIFENVANNQNVVVWNTTQGIFAWSFAFGDIDLDGHKEFITADGSTLGRVYIYENTGDNQYEWVCTDTVRLPNGSDVFSGNDLDGDGKPEFFVGFARIVGGSTWDFFLYMWEATGNNTYERTHIATIRAVDWLEKRSKCGDIDGDGIEELVWSIGSQVIVYKATGNNQFERIWTWYYDHGGDYPHSLVNIYDMNRNGYNEIVVSGNNKTSIFEVEAVWLRRPNSGENYVGNSQEQIRWQKFYPPRCDSLSLFYSLDNGRTYDTITTGLPGVDSTYLWTVPDTSSDSCKVKIIAYGPGWQFDESDGVFTITPSGIDEIASPSLAMTSIKISPNVIKSQALICFTLPNAQEISLKLYDITGKLVKVFCDGYRESGIYKINLKAKDYSSGIYFIRLQTESSKSTIERIMIIY